MDAITVIRRGYDDLHAAVRADAAQVQSNWWFERPGGAPNTIGHQLWHLVRDEDYILSFLSGQRQVSATGGWSERFGLEIDESSGRTALDPPQAAALRFDPAEWLAFADAVWSRTGPALDTITPERLTEPAWPGAPPEWDVARQLVEGSLCHGWLHLGEVRILMGMQGWHGE